MSRGNEAERGAQGWPIGSALSSFGKRWTLDAGHRFGRREAGEMIRTSNEPISLIIWEVAPFGCVHRCTNQ